MKLVTIKSSLKDEVEKHRADALESMFAATALVRNSLGSDDKAKDQDMH